MSFSNTMTPAPIHNRLLADGYKRARAITEFEMRELVTSEYAEQLQQATGSPAELDRLRREIEQEVFARLRRVAPPHGHY
jgi:hypothetical protein